MYPNLTGEEALRILQNAWNPDKAYDLFAHAGEIRDKVLGNRLWWSLGLGGVFPCLVKPCCSYCTYHVEKMFLTDVLLKGLEIIESLGEFSSISKLLLL